MSFYKLSLPVFSMEKREFRDERTWAKIRDGGSGAYVDYIYGYRDGTDNHGHLIASDGLVIFDRRLSGPSGAFLIPTGSGLPVEIFSDDSNIPDNARLFFSEAIIEPERIKFVSGSIPAKTE